MIEVSNLSKRYLIRHEDAPYQTLRDRLAHPIRAFRDKLAHKPEEFWALNDLSFSVAPGEVLGIIGQNGSGKSTLLKVLSQITLPTKGRAVLKGTVASLLEVGTGFHPELSGRENIFLSGVILGMTKKEVSRKFDEIVNFAGVEKFLDTPVKYYSSGMGVRLGFAVAASLDSDILIIDEVLAVGDAEFQKKCLAKMDDVAKNQGRTILFVSHNLEAVQNICTKVMILKKGQIDAIDQVESCLKKYINDQSELISSTVINSDDRHYGLGNFAKFSHIYLSNASGERLDDFIMGQSLRLNLNFSLKQALPNIELGFRISTITGIALSYFVSDWEGFSGSFAEGEHRVSCLIPKLACLPGIYEISAWIKQQGAGADQQIDSAVRFNVVNGNINNLNADFGRYGNPGVYQPNTWAIESNS